MPFMIPCGFSKEKGDGLNTDTEFPVLPDVNQDLLRSEYIATVDSVVEHGHMTV